MSNSLLDTLKSTGNQYPDEGLLRLYAIIRIIFSYCMLHTITFGHVLYSPLFYPNSFWTPISMSFWIGGPPDPWLLQWISILAIVSTILLGLGLFTRAMGPICFVFCTLLLCISFSYGRLNHNANTVPLLLFVFSFSEWGQYYSLDALIRRFRKKRAPLMASADPQWPITITLAVFSLPYFTTGFFKILKGNFVEPGYIPALIKYKQIFWEAHGGNIPELTRTIQNFFVANPIFMDVLTYVTLFIETCFFISLLSRHSRVFMLAGALILHSSITVTTKIYFLEHMFMLAILLFATVILLSREKVAWLARLFPTRPLPEDQFQLDPVKKPLWQHALWAYAAAVIAAMMLPKLHLPEIAYSQWLALKSLRYPYGLFPTDTYLFGYTSDILLGYIFWLLSFLVLSYFGLGFLRRVMAALFQTVPRDLANTKRILIYDGDCGFCQSWCDWALAKQGNRFIEFTPWQALALDFRARLGVTDAEFMQHAYYVELQGEEITLMKKGAGAINAVLRWLPGGSNAVFRLLSILYDIDGIRHLEDIGYHWIAQNRYRLSGGKVCPMPQTK